MRIRVRRLATAAAVLLALSLIPTLAIAQSASPTPRSRGSPMANRISGSTEARVRRQPDQRYRVGTRDFSSSNQLSAMRISRGRAVAPLSSPSARAMPTNRPSGNTSKLRGSVDILSCIDDVKRVGVPKLRLGEVVTVTAAH